MSIQEVLTNQSTWLPFFFFFNNIYVSEQRVVCCSHQSDRLGYVSRTKQIAALRYVSRTNQSVVFVLWFEKCSNFNEVTGYSERAVPNRIIFQNEKCWLFCVLNMYMYFTALYEKCDTTEQMKDVRLPIVNLLLVL